MPCLPRTQRRRRGAALFHHFKDPIMITEGRMQYLYDERGRRYLDVRPLQPA
jgi:alanine-glyoxylate transaminase/(R)-3-amino-2-methylpropionate-pyruvate transaminase